MTDERTLITELGALHAAVAQAVEEITARDSDGSFLERVLRDALAARLLNAGTERPLNLDSAVWPGRLGGVDVLYSPDEGIWIGVETKVWDMADSLYDLVKLAAGTQRGTITAGFCVVAGRQRDWMSPNAVRDLSTSLGSTVERGIAILLRNDPRSWKSIWSRTAIRPGAVPARIRTVAGEPVSMPGVPDHEIRLIGVQATSDEQLRLDSAGNPS
jgi:hypothetical protein